MPRTLQIVALDGPRSTPDYDFQITTAMRTIAARWIGLISDGKSHVSNAQTGPSVYAGTLRRSRIIPAFVPRSVNYL